MLQILRLLLPQKSKFVISTNYGVVLHCTPSVEQKAKKSQQFLSEAPRELHYIEKPVFKKKVNSQNQWIF